MKYVISIDQSTQGTKAMLFDAQGKLVCRADLSHKQLVSPEGWVSHRPKDLYGNTLKAVARLLDSAGIPKEEVACLGVSNQRETALAWDRRTGKPIGDAVVWHCIRAEALCHEASLAQYAELIRERTGLPLSPYFSAAKWAWLLRSLPRAAEAARASHICVGTVDTWLIWNMTGGKRFVTDVSNAARTQLFNIDTMEWDDALCEVFGIPRACLAEVVDTNANFGETDLEGLLPRPIPILCAMGDSNGALFGQGCLEKGMVKATYGTGSSIMMQIGPKPLKSANGLATSIAWRLGGSVDYVLEGNINYAGATVRWMKEQAAWIQEEGETEALARQADARDATYLVPAFTGLGAPHWDSNAPALLVGMGPGTGRAELVKAGLESIAYQIQDVLAAMAEDAGDPVQALRADGGATKNRYLMQFQSDIAAVPLQVTDLEELSGIGAAYIAGMAAGLYAPQTLQENIRRSPYVPKLDAAERQRRLKGWHDAVARSRYRPQ